MVVELRALVLRGKTGGGAVILFCISAFASLSSSFLSITSFEFIAVSSFIIFSSFFKVFDSKIIKIKIFFMHIKI